MAYRLTKEALRHDLFVAFLCAQKHKSNKPYVVKFRENLDENLDSLCDDLWTRAYKPEPSTCFIVERPKKREVFAAQFRDRVVHHLYYNYLHELYERTFIEDSYSCIPGRGTHYGISRLAKHIRQESHNYQEKCYVMNLDIRGYFMHINRQILLRQALISINKMASHKVYGKGRQTWADVLDIDFLTWLTEEIVLLDPKINCHIVGKRADWIGLDRSKSLFYTEDGCGLPIGNLTSQLLSNVYLNLFDQFMKRVLHCKHYGRYVDDSFVVSRDRQWLLSLVPYIREFLKQTLGLDLHMGKLQIVNANYGAEFLGAYVKPYRIYVSNKSLERTRQNILRLGLDDLEAAERSLNSFLGMLVHVSSYNVRANLFLTPQILSIGTLDRDITKFVLTPQEPLAVAA